MKNRRPIFFTSDWHIGHANSIKFDNRPFKDLDHMHGVLINNYNAIVPKDGICYHLGDVGMSSIDTLKNVINKLNGTKVLVLGNHDGNVNRMYNVGFDVVLYGAILYIAGERVSLSHCPLKGVFREDVKGMSNNKGDINWHGESRHHRFTIENNGQFHLHGHIHSNKENGKPKVDGKQYDVGVPSNDYRPVSISKIESWISRYKTK